MLSNVVTYTFPSGLYDGRMRDQDTDHTIYRIQTKSPLLGPSCTNVTSHYGRRVGAIHWKSVLKPMTVTLRGTTVPAEQILSVKPHSPRKMWVDDFGNPFYWNGTECHDAENRVIARLDRPLDESEPVTLSVDGAFLSSLDMILFTALIIGHTRQHKQNIISTATNPSIKLSGSVAYCRSPPHSISSEEKVALVW